MIKKAHLFMLILSVYMQALVFALVFLSVFAEAAYGMAADLLTLQNASLILSFAVPFAVYMSVSKRKFAEVLPFAPLSAANALYVLVLSVSSIPLMMAVSFVSSAFFENNAAAFLTDLQGRPFFPVFLSLAALPAVLEEIVFRGALLTELKAAGIKKAAVLSGLYFALIHMDFQQFPYAMIMGMIFAYLVLYTKSILASVFAHFIINASMVFLWLLDPDLEVYLLPACLAAAPVFVYTFRNFLAHNAANAAETGAESNAADGPADKKLLTWEFWAVAGFYAVITIVYFNLS